MRMTASDLAGWNRVAFDTWLLGCEASVVIGMRCWQIALGGPTADREAQRMVVEKLEALMALQVAMLTGGLGATPLIASGRTVKHYRSKVAANRRRLSRG